MSKPDFEVLSYYKGYTGKNCEVDIDECLAKKCQNNATCLTPYINMYQCLCQNGYEGYNCETSTDLCKINPCYYNSTCIQSQLLEIRCLCTPGFTGDRYET
jgi:hypothetical protein